MNRCSCNKRSLQFSASQVFLVAAFSSEHWVPTVVVVSGADGNAHVGDQVKFLLMVQVMVRMVVQV